MKTFEHDGDPSFAPRSHPWTRADASDAFRYVDLRATPALVRTALEDFVPWRRYAAIETFYVLVEWLNGARSTVESNDCAFAPPERTARTDRRKRVECSGRVMILFRDLARNLTTDDWPEMALALHRALAVTDPKLEGGAIGTTLVPVRYLALPGDADAQLGRELMISFWAWGADEAQAMTHLNRVLVNLSRALTSVAKA